VVGTLDDATRHGAHSGFEIAHLLPALVQLSVGQRDGLALLFSDASATRMHAALRALAGEVPHCRLWWNDAAEVLTLSGGRPEAIAGLHITFFPETYAALTARGYTAAYVPYLFTRPRETAAAPLQKCIFYAAEIDISDSCFAATELAGDRLRAVSDRCWELANAITEGRMSSIEADGLLGEQLGEDASEHSTHRMAMWAVRNRLRYLLVKAVTETFGSHLQLFHRGWRDLGFRADPGRITVRQCIDHYATARVSLDVGGKSSHASLYPRVADVLSVAGGLVQFLPRGDPEEGTPVLPQRQARTAQELLTLIDRLLTAPAERVLDENAEMFARYRGARLDAGAALIEAITTYCATRS